MATPSGATTMSLSYEVLEQARSAARPDGATAIGLRDSAGVPYYLRAHYWWAYIHPRAVRFFERQWVVNAILWGHYARLRDAALGELGESLPGGTLQVGCVYGNLTCRLSARAAAGHGTIDVVDVLPIQLDNLRRKLPADAPVRPLRMDSTRLAAADGRYDRALVFFLLHEQPSRDRARTLDEVVRVVRPGGTIVIVDYAMPRWWHPLRYVWRPLLARLEPFALDLWRSDVADLLRGARVVRLRKHSYFGGLYQKVVAARAGGPA